MKKIIKIAMVMLAVCIAAPTVYAQNYGLTEKEMKKNHKLAEKQAKKAAKQLKKEKWIYAGANTLEDELTRYLMATDFSNGKFEQAVETAPRVPSLKRGESQARSMAENDLVREIRIAIQGEIGELDGNAGGSYDEVQVDKWSKRVADELEGDLKRYFYIYKQNSDKTYDVRVYFAKPAVIGSGAFKKNIKNNIDFIEDIKKSMGD